jgi:pyruvate dehydrogenase E2 component (dihydrolipoamide acetyltransferase)
MAISVVMPALEMAQETGKLISWLKKEGELVAQGEPLLEVETDKAVMEIESPASGVLVGIKVEAGTEVPVGRTIAWIVQPGEVPPTDEVATASGRKTTAVVPSATSISESADQTPPPMQSVTQPIKISPKARRLASERGVNLSDVRGSGAGGEILASDIVAVAESKASTPPAKIPNINSISRLMADRTTQSWTTVPHFFIVREVDASALNEARLKLGPAIEQSHRVKLTHSDLLVALVAVVLRKHPRINSSWSSSDGIRANSEINLGLAMAVDDGVVAPVIHNASQTELSEIALQRHGLTERARGGKLRPDDIAGGTFTISNLGMFGVDAFTAIIIPPQAAILAVGAITDRVVPVSGLPAIRPTMTLTLSSDHRVVDGARAADFLRDLVEAILNPLQYFKAAGNAD